MQRTNGGPGCGYKEEEKALKDEVTLYLTGLFPDVKHNLMLTNIALCSHVEGAQAIFVFE